MILPEPISPERREDVIAHVAARLLGAYRYFRAHRQAGTSGRTSEPRRSLPKVGRNDPFPCSSGKKYKKCWRGDGELRLLTDDFAIEAAIHAGKVTGALSGGGAPLVFFDARKLRLDWLDAATLH